MLSCCGCAEKTRPDDSGEPGTVYLTDEKASLIGGTHVSAASQHKGTTEVSQLADVKESELTISEQCGVQVDITPSGEMANASIEPEREPSTQGGGGSHSLAGGSPEEAPASSSNYRPVTLDSPAARRAETHGEVSRGSNASTSRANQSSVYTSGRRSSLASTQSWRTGRTRNYFSEEEWRGRISPQSRRSTAFGKTMSIAMPNPANLLLVVPAIRKGLQKFRERILSAKKPSDIEADRGVQIERIYDAYLFNEKIIRAKKVEDAVFHHRPMIDLQDIEKQDDDISIVDSSSSGSEFEGDEEMYRFNSGDSDSGMRAGRSSAVPKASASPTSGKISQEERKKRRSRLLALRKNECITHWGVVAGRLMHLHVLDFGQAAKSYAVRKKWSGKRSSNMLFQNVRARARVVAAKAYELSKKVNKESKDCFDSQWADDGYLQHLFGENFVDTLALLANAVVKICAAQPALVDAEAPCKVFGDIHGQFRDLLLCFRVFGAPDECGAPMFVFNGDFVDRGVHQLEVIGLLLAYKVLLPDRVWLVRGNHESEYMNERYGFAEECEQRLGDLGPKVFKLFHKVFNQLPIACLISRRILVVHGGLGDGTWRLDDIRAIKRPLPDPTEPDKLWIYNLLWSDPIEDDDAREQDVFGVHESPRGAKACRFGWNVTKMFCARNGLSMVIRSHQVKRDGSGFDVMHENLLMRVFTARDYEGHRNDGAILAIRPADPGNPEGLLIVRPQVLRSASKSAS